MFLAIADVLNNARQENGTYFVQVGFAIHSVDITS